jgi:NTP pyrophosphatase (non-canonical NTP hydrolase)
LTTAGRLGTLPGANVNIRPQNDDPRAETLAKRGAERLAAFVLKLGQTVDGVEERIEAFLASDDSKSAAQLAARYLTEIKGARRRYHGYEGAQELADRLDQILDIIETAVLPASPSAALDLTVQFIESDGYAFETADDSYGHIGAVFGRACALFADAAKSLPSADTLPIFKRLVASDAYGARGDLIKGVGRFLDQAHLDAFVGELRAALAGGGASAAGACWRLKAVAESIRDPVLYEDAIRAGKQDDLPPSLAVDVARHYLDAGRPKDALAKLPTSAESLGGYGFDFHDIRVRALAALGETEALRSALWAKFVQAPSPDALDKLLAAEPADARAARRKAALEEARARLPAQSMAEFFAEIGELADAATVVLGAPGGLNGDLYFGLVPLAEKLESTYPLAASLVYRALLESILRRGQSKYYHHGARYWVLLLQIGPRIADWKGFESDVQYRERIGREHPRKTAFWHAAKEAMAKG